MTTKERFSRRPFAGTPYARYKKIMSVCLGMATMAALSAEFVWDGDDTSSWRDPASYKDNTAQALPGSSDTVVFPNKHARRHAVREYRHVPAHVPECEWRGEPCQLDAGDGGGRLQPHPHVRGRHDGSDPLHASWPSDFN